MTAGCCSVVDFSSSLPLAYRDEVLYMVSTAQSRLHSPLPFALSTTTGKSTGCLALVLTRLPPLHALFRLQLSSITRLLTMVSASGQHLS